MGNALKIKKYDVDLLKIFEMRISFRYTMMMMCRAAQRYGVE